MVIEELDRSDLKKDKGYQQTVRYFPRYDKVTTEAYLNSFLNPFGKHPGRAKWQRTRRSVPLCTGTLNETYRGENLKKGQRKEDEDNENGEYLRSISSQ